MKRRLIIMVLAVVLLLNCTSCLSQAKPDLDNVDRYTEQDILNLNNKPASEVFVKNVYGKVAEIWGKFTNVEIVDEESAADSLWSINNLIGIKNPSLELKCYASHIDEYTAQFKFYQVYKGHEVLNSEIQITQSKTDDGNDNVTSFLIPTSVLDQADDRPGITFTQAQEIVHGHYKQVDYADITFDKLSWFIVGHGSNASAELVYTIEIGEDRTLYIDATSGEVLGDIGLDY